MFYSSGTNWLEINKKLEHNFVIKEAQSIDGKTWKTKSNSIVQQKFTEEAIARPSLIQLDKVWCLFFVTGAIMTLGMARTPIESDIQCRMI